LFDYSRRSREAELLDDAALDGDELARTLDELETINRLLGGHAASFAGLEELLPATPRSLSVLDVGTGCGDFPRRVSAWARRRGIEVRVRGIDLSAATVAHARARSRLVRNDAPVSVLRAFRRHELEALATAAGLPRPRIAWRWAFRWVMVVRR
jgi:SAM-dependent methyltransferase